MTVAATASRRRERASVSDRLPAAALGFLVAPVLTASGGYYPTSWGWTAAALAGAAVVAASLREQSRPSRAEILFAGGLIAFTLWEIVATTWSQAPSQSPLEVERTLVFVAGALAVKAVVARRRAGDLLGGVLAGAALVCAYAVATRAFPAHFTQDTYGGGRLATPVGYWNGLGLLAVMTALLALAFAARASSLAARSAAAAAVPVAVAALYFTFSRGSWLALGLGLAVLVAFDRRRLHLLLVGVPLAVVAGLAIASIAGSGGGTSAASTAGAQAHGDRWAGVIVAAAVISANVVLGLRQLEKRVRVRRRVRRAAGWAVVAATILALVGAFAHYGAPTTLAHRAYHSMLTSAPSGGADLNKRLFSLSSNGRLAHWRVGIHMFEAHPLGGTGPGSYEQAWFRDRPANWKVRDAHNLYVETLAEDGIVGLVLLAAALVAPLVAFVRARRQPLAAAALAAYVAYLGHAAVDWDWELTGLTLTALFCGGALLAWGRPESPAPARRTPAIALAAVVALAALYGLMGNLAIAASGHAASVGDFSRAATDARRARLIAPWSATPWQLLGEAQLGLGQYAAARASLEKAVSMSSRDWELWLDVARASGGRQRAAALARAQQLNPLETSIAVFGRSLPKPGRR